MARARLVHPELSRHEGLALLSREHRFLFALFPTISDRLGYVEDRPRRIQADLFPYDAIPDGVVAGWIDDLVRAGFLERVEIRGTALILIPGFKRWQKPHPREKTSEWDPDGKPKASQRLTQGEPKASPERESPPDPVSDPVTDPVQKQEILSCAPETAPADRTVVEPSEKPPRKAKAPAEKPADSDSDFVHRACRVWPWLDAGEVREFEVTAHEAYPALDLAQCASAARAWELGKPKNKRRKAVLAFLRNWFQTAQTQADRQVPGAVPLKSRFAPPAEPPSNVPDAAESQARRDRERAELEADRKLHPPPDPERLASLRRIAAGGKP